MFKSVVFVGLIIFGGPSFVLADFSEKTQPSFQFGHTAQVKGVAITPDGRTILSVGNDSTLKFWNMTTAKEIQSIEGHYLVAVTPDGTHALFSDSLYKIKLMEISTGELIREYVGHTFPITSLSISLDGQTAVSGSWDTTVKLWDIATGKEIRTFSGHRGWVHSVALVPGGEYALSGSGDNTMKQWELSTGKEVRTFFGHQSSVASVAVTPDGKYAASGSYDKTVRLWDLSTGKEIRTFLGHTDCILSVAFTPDGKWMVSGGNDKTLRLWDVGTGKEVRVLAGHSGAITSIAVSPGGTHVVSGSEDKSLKLWDILTGKEVRTFKTTEITNDAPLELLLEGVTLTITDANQELYSGVYALHAAVMSGNRDAVLKLLAAGAHPNQKTGDGNQSSPLHFAAFRGDTSLITMLFNHGADPYSKTTNNVTPLDIAINQGHLEAIRYLEALSLKGRFTDFWNEAMRAIGIELQNRYAAQYTPRNTFYSDRHRFELASEYGVLGMGLAKSNIITSWENSNINLKDVTIKVDASYSQINSITIDGSYGTKVDTLSDDTIRHNKALDMNFMVLLTGASFEQKDADKVIDALNNNKKKYKEWNSPYKGQGWFACEVSTVEVNKKEYIFIVKESLMSTTLLGNGLTINYK